MLKYSNIIWNIEWKVFEWKWKGIVLHEFEMEGLKTEDEIREKKENYDKYI